MFQGVSSAARAAACARRSPSARSASASASSARSPCTRPIIAKIEVVTRGDVRRAKLYYLRDRVGKAAKIKEKRDRPTRRGADPSAGACTRAMPAPAGRSRRVRAGRGHRPAAPPRSNSPPTSLRSGAAVPPRRGVVVAFLVRRSSPRRSSSRRRRWCHSLEVGDRVSSPGCRTSSTTPGAATSSCSPRPPRRQLRGDQAQTSPSRVSTPPWRASAPPAVDRGLHQAGDRPPRRDGRGPQRRRLIDGRVLVEPYLADRVVTADFGPRRSPTASCGSWATTGTELRRTAASSVADQDVDDRGPGDPRIWPVTGWLL